MAFRISFGNIFFSAATCFFLSGGSTLRAVTLVQDGKAQATIIIPQNAPPLTVSSAEELATYLKRISGATVKITDQPDSVTTAGRIWVGYRPEIADLMPKEGKDLKHPEEIYLKATDKDLILFGRDASRGGRQVEAGTWLAVHSYLQDYLGVRWLWPGELGTEVPEKKTVVAEPFVYQYHPKLLSRELRGVNALRSFDSVVKGDLFPAGNELKDKLVKKDEEVRQWLNRHKADHAASGDSPSPVRGSLTFNAGHAYTSWWNRFHAEHPEWFALQPDGTRGPFPNIKDVKINPSNPEVAEQWLKDAKHFFTTRPDRLVFSAAENDRGWQGYCVCETCLSWDSPNAPFLESSLVWATKRDGQSRALTDRYVKYWNTLARGLQEAFPDRELYVGVMAYNAMRPPPVTEKLEKNVAVAFEGIHVRNPIGNSRKDEAIGREMWKGWAERAELMVWRPNLIHQTAGLPYVFPRRHADNMRFLADNKMVGISVDSIENHWATQGPIYYVVAQLTWNPYLNVEDVLKDYYQSAFGPAAPYIAEYFDLFEKLYDEFADEYAEANWHRSRDLPKLYRERMIGERPDKTKRLGTEGVARNQDLESAAAALLVKAKEAVANSPKRYQERVAFVADGFEFTQLQLDAIQAMNDLRDGNGQRADLVEKAEAAGQRRKEFLQRHFDSHAISYPAMAGRLLVGGASDFGPPSLAKKFRKLEVKTKALDDEKGATPIIPGASEKVEKPADL